MKFPPRLATSILKLCKRDAVSVARAAKYEQSPMYTCITTKSSTHTNTVYEHCKKIVIIYPVGVSQSYGNLNHIIIEISKKKKKKFDSGNDFRSLTWPVKSIEVTQPKRNIRRWTKLCVGADTLVTALENWFLYNICSNFRNHDKFFRMFLKQMKFYILFREFMNEKLVFSLKKL